MTTTEPDLTAADVAWDLDPLVDGQGPAGVDALLDEAERHAGGIAGQRGRVAALDAAGLEALMVALAAVQELVGRAGSYAGLRFAVDTADPERGALLQHVEERATAISTQLLFFELEWAELPDDRVAVLLASDRIAFCRHYLESVRRYRDHLLSEPEERLLTEKAVTGRNAWSRLFSELSSAITVDLDDTTASLEEALSRLASPDRDQRRRAAEAVTAGLAPGVRTRAFVFNTLLADKATDDRLRRYPHWLANRNLDNEASDESVAALVTAVERRYDIPQRWYALKARLLGVDRIADYDRMASVAEQDAEIGWRDAHELVLDAYSSFSPELAEIAARFFDERWIDAPVR
ncbi:MAG: M3 family oligoendopeptidase, partial [Acidimicrobiia bacterium]